MSTVLAMAVSSAATLVAPAVAHASLTGFFSHNAVTVVPANATVSVRLDCPDVRTSLGGQIVATPEQMGNVVVFASYPEDRGWRVMVHNYTTSAQQVTPGVTCGVLTNRVVVRAPVNLPAQGTASASATCPSGLVNVGGGYRSVDFRTVSVRTNRPFTSGHGWLFTVYDAATTNQPEIASYAVCGTVSGRVLRDSSVQVAPGTTVQAAAVCPEGKDAVSGGWVTNSDEGWSLVQAGSTFASYDIDFRNPSTTTTYTMVSRAVCVTTA
jgi:hypothetical protein